MKKLINNPENLVVEMCKGFVLGYPDAGAHGLGVIFTDIAEHIK